MGTTDKMAHLARRLAAVQFAKPYRVLLSALLVALVSLPFAMRLRLDSSFEALLPSDTPSVRDLNETRNRLGGLNQLTVALLSTNTEALQRFAVDLVPRLEGLRGQGIGVVSVEWNISEYEDFVRSHKELYAPLADLTEVRDAIEERLDYEKSKRNPLFFDLRDNDEAPESLDEALDKLKAKANSAERGKDKYPGGFYLHPNRDLLALFVRTDLSNGDFQGTEKLISAIEREVTALNPQSYAKDFRVEFAGGIKHAQEEQTAIKDELTISSALTVALVFLAIYVFFLRKRALPILGLSMLTPLSVTYAYAALVVGGLNSSTAFLGSIVLGNGINPNIIWLARYFEKRKSGMSVEPAIAEAHHSTWNATLTAALAASISYGSLALTDFRGFRDFGLIGGVGLMLCWASTHLIQPAIVVWSERVKPLRFTDGVIPRNPYGRAFFFVVSRAPRAVIAVSILLTVGGVAAVSYAVTHDPLEYDFRKLKSVREESSRVTTLNRLVNDIVSGSDAGDGIAIVTSSPEEALSVVQQLEARRATGDAPYGRVRTIDSLLPTDQPQKVEVLREIRESMLSARKYLKGEDLKKLDENLPPEAITPLTAAQLPDSVARMFTERDGTRGRVLYVENLKKSVNGEAVPSTWDGRYLIRWAGALRELRVGDDKRPPLAGRAPVFADMVEVVWRDGPRAVVFSLVATCLLLALSFRRWRDRFATLGALLVGITWMTGTMAVLKMRLNFLNFVAFPISFGNGADYGVNVFQRFVQETKGSLALSGAKLRDAIRETVENSGGAVILCSTTTCIGYSSLYASANQALNSFGAAMVISELSCLVSAVLMVPSIFWLIARKKDSPR